MSGKNPIPKAKPDDHEDVSWALSTAEATWNRGDRPDALKWLRRAAEAASEAEADDRALELAKAAAEVATNLEENKSESSVSESIPISMSTGAPPSSPPSRPPLSAALTSPAFVPQRPPKAAPKKPPNLPNSNKVEAQKPKAPAPAVAAAVKAPKAAASSPTGARAPAKLILAPPSAPSDSQVMTPKAASTGALPAAKDSDDDLFRARPAPPQEVEETSPPTPRSKRNTQNPTAAPSEGDDEDAWPTQSMSGNDLPSFDNLEDKTRIGTPAYREPPIEPSQRAPIAMRGIRPSQAVRVVVWRGPDGVHVAPHGTMVTAISVDAMLVALDPSADLSAWLANK